MPLIHIVVLFRVPCFVNVPPPTSPPLQRDSCNAVFNTNTSGIIPHHLSFCSPFSHWIKKLQVVQQCCSSGGLAIVEKESEMMKII